MSEPKWIVRGGWINVHIEMPPPGRIVEVCQHVFDDIESTADTMSFQFATHPDGNWHWEPDGHASSVEPSHWRPLSGEKASAMVSAALEDRSRIHCRTVA